MKLLNIKLLFALATVSLLFTSCSKEENVYDNENLSIELQGFEMEEGIYELDYRVAKQPEGESVMLYLSYFSNLDGKKIDRNITDVADIEYEIDGVIRSVSDREYLRTPITSEGRNITFKITLKEDYVGQIGRLYGFADSGAEKDYVTFDFMAEQAIEE